MTRATIVILAALAFLSRVVAGPCNPDLIFTEDFDAVIPPTLPDGWVATNAIDPDGIFWITSNSGDPSPPADSPPNAVFVNDPSAISDKRLDSAHIAQKTGDPRMQVTFQNNFSFQDGFDGGVLEISADGGNTFQDILTHGTFLTGGYNGTISTCCGNPLAGRQAWTGNSGGFITTTVDVQAGGTFIVFRWRMGSDVSGSGEGWRIDTISITECEKLPPPTITPTPSVSPTPTPTITPPPTPPFGTPTPPPTPRPSPTPRSRPTPLPRPTPWG